jgi:hypothetical protein
LQRAFLKPSFTRVIAADLRMPIGIHGTLCTGLSSKFSVERRMNDFDREQLETLIEEEEEFLARLEGLLATNSRELDRARVLELIGCASAELKSLYRMRDCLMDERASCRSSSAMH